MASLSSDELLAAALDLPPEERAELARNLLASLDDVEGDELSPEEWDAAWSAEIARRLETIRRGDAELIDGDEAMQRVRERLGSRTK